MQKKGQIMDLINIRDSLSLVWNLEKWQKFDAKTSSNQNSILKKGGFRTFLFQTENLFFYIDF